MSDLPPTRSNGPLDLPLTRRQRFWQFWWHDHAWLRALWSNLHRLDADVYRANQPSPARLRQFRDLGIRSVLSLRGEAGLPSQIGAAGSAALGLEFRAINLRARRLPPKAQLLALLDALRTMPKPMVMHCKSGADRTGLASAIYLHVFKGVPLPEARRQLALRYAHVRIGQAGILHGLLDAYEAAHDATGIGFEDWVREQYDPTTLT